MSDPHSRYLVLLLIMTYGLSGCGHKKAPEPEVKDLSQVQMTTDVWNTIPEGPEKYEQGLLARLRKEDPQFKSTAEWKKFQKDVLAPGAAEVFGRPIDLK